MALASFRNTRPRPPRTSSRRTTSWPSSSVMPCSWSSVATGLFRGASNTASMVALSAPARIVSAGLSALAEKQGQRVDEDRLPRARLAREDVQARAERDRQRLDDCEVTDPELS